jgi:shikimate kinase
VEVLGVSHGGTFNWATLDVRVMIRENATPTHLRKAADDADLGANVQPVPHGVDIAVMVITLIGYRGSGKSTVAPLVAASLGWQWIDSDTEIERTAGCSIREIFESEGEAGFRQRESSVLAQLLTNDQLVIAAGGGAVLADANRELMRRAGVVFWLTASPAVLASRIAGDQSTVERRPSLTGRSVLDEIESVLEARQPCYQDAATHVVDTERLSRDQVVATIVSAVRQHSSAGDFD